MNLYEIQPVELDSTQKLLVFSPDDEAEAELSRFIQENSELVSKICSEKSELNCIPRGMSILIPAENVHAMLVYLEEKYPSIERSQWIDMNEVKKDSEWHKLHQPLPEDWESDPNG